MCRALEEGRRKGCRAKTLDRQISLWYKSTRKEAVVLFDVMVFLRLLIGKGPRQMARTKDPETLLLEAGQLLDTYGGLLTERQRQFMRLHFEEDLSFSEIAREFHISRQAVHDAVKHAVQTLKTLERNLRLVEMAHGTPGTGDGHIAGRQLIERLIRLRRRAEGEPDLADYLWLFEELDALISLLGGGKTTDSAEC